MQYLRKFLDFLKRYIPNQIVDRSQDLFWGIIDSIRNSSFGFLYILIIPFVFFVAVISSIGLFFKRFYRYFINFVTLIVDEVRVYVTQLHQASKNFRYTWGNAFSLSSDFAFYLFAKNFNDDVRFERSYRGSYQNLILDLFMYSAAWVFWLSVVILIFALLLWLLYSVAISLWVGFSTVSILSLILLLVVPSLHRIIRLYLTNQDNIVFVRSVLNSSTHRSFFLFFIVVIIIGSISAILLTNNSRANTMVVLQSPTPIITDTLTPLPTIPLILPTILPIATIAPIPTNTATVTSTNTPTLIPTRKPTSTHTPTYTPTLTTTPLIFSGVQFDLSPQDVELSGWEQCWSGLYSKSDQLDDIFQACSGAWLLIACRSVSSMNFDVAAMAPREAVLHDTGKGATSVFTYNGVDWYFNPDHSWGFVKTGDSVFRSNCDISGGNTGLCWHTSNNQVVDGYKCGSADRLNNSDEYERMIYHLSKKIQSFPIIGP